VFARFLAEASQTVLAQRQAGRNLDAERGAANVRLRAERRVGELLKELARAETPNPHGIGGRSGKLVTSAEATQQSPYAEALEQHGMSRQAAHRFQALADMPAERFEEALQAPEKPSTAGILRHVEARREAPAPTPTPKVARRCSSRSTPASGRPRAECRQRPRSRRLRSSRRRCLRYSCRYRRRCRGCSSGEQRSAVP
jgi:hypothetical protein